MSMVAMEYTMKVMTPVMLLPLIKHILRYTIARPILEPQGCGHPDQRMSEA